MLDSYPSAEKAVGRHLSYLCAFSGDRMISRLNILVKVSVFKLGIIVNLGMNFIFLILLWISCYVIDWDSCTPTQMTLSYKEDPNIPIMLKLIRVYQANLSQPNIRDMIIVFAISQISTCDSVKNNPRVTRLRYTPPTPDQKQWCTLRNSQVDKLQLVNVVLNGRFAIARYSLRQNRYIISPAAV